MSITIDDIAREVGVSASTVSRSLRHDRLIHPQTRARVLQVAMSMGYQGRSRKRPASVRGQATVGVLLAYPGLEHLQGLPNVRRYLEGLSAEADATGATLVIEPYKFVFDQTAAVDGMPRLLSKRQCDIVILVGQFRPEHVHAFAARRAVVSINWPYTGSDVDVVTVDNVGGLRQVVQHLADLGHTRLAWVDGPYPAPFFEARQAGMLQACLQRGLALADQQFYPQASATDEATVDRIADALRARRVTAAVCVNDETAVALGNRLLTRGLSLPRDGALTGFDATGETLSNGQTLTTVDPGFVEVGRAALRTALLRLRQPAGRRFTMSFDARLRPASTTG